MKRFRTTAAMLALALTALVAHGAPVVIDFEGQIPTGSNRTGDPIFPYTEDGFRLTDVNSGSANALFGPSGIQNDNGTDVLGWGSGSTFQVSSVTGDLLSLLAFDATNLDPQGSAGQFNVTGFYGAGGSVSATFNSTFNSFTTFGFGSAWTGLSSVRIQNVNMVNGAIDNIRLDAAAVPEPTTIALVGAALAAIALSRRRRLIKPEPSCGTNRAG